MILMASVSDVDSELLLDFVIVKGIGATPNDLVVAFDNLVKAHSASHALPGTRTSAVSPLFLHCSSGLIR